MPYIDSYRLALLKRESSSARSVENSFYLPKSNKSPRRYKAYYKYDTSGTEIAMQKMYNYNI